MSSSTVRWGGLSGVFASAMFVVTVILNQLAALQRVYDSPGDYLYQVVVLAAYAGVVVVLVGLHAPQREIWRYGRLGPLTPCYPSLAMR